MLSDFVAGVPEWVWPMLPALAFLLLMIGAAIHACYFDHAGKPANNHYLAWSVFWPIVTPLWLASLPIRRLVSWWRGRREEPVAEPTVCDAVCASIESEPESWRMTRLTFDGPRGWSIWNGDACSRWQVYHGGVKFRRTERKRIRAAALRWAARNAAPAPTEPNRSKAQRIPTGGEPRNLGADVDAIHEKLLRLENLGNDSLYALSVQCNTLVDRLAALESKQPGDVRGSWWLWHFSSGDTLYRCYDEKRKGTGTFTFWGSADHTQGGAGGTHGHFSHEGCTEITFTRALTWLRTMGWPAEALKLAEEAWAQGCI